MSHLMPVAINRTRCEVFWDNGCVTRIVNLLDDEGEQTDDPAEAVVAVVQSPDWLWHVLRFADYSKASMN